MVGHPNVRAPPAGGRGTAGKASMPRSVFSLGERGMRPAGLRAHDRRSHQTFTCRRQTAGMRVLVVEDEPRMAQLIKGSLTRSGVAADVADSGEEALWRAQSVDYDGIVLDVMLPGMSGFAACRALREHGLWSPVLMLTARESVEDRVALRGRRSGRQRAQPLRVGARPTRGGRSRSTRRLDSRSTGQVAPRAGARESRRERVAPRCGRRADRGSRRRAARAVGQRRRPGIPRGVPAAGLRPVQPRERGHAGKGTALGLAIVDAIARAHGGLAEAANRREGAEVRLTLPQESLPDVATPTAGCNASDQPA